ncbi:hypothetical protein B0T20DRAFT_394017 [Sordaria brevicollis]|uniref:Uncharacterized protein n=1 Tax=Sordaria brevicollis TaxID=83679 RepID=A0AAE0PBH4_SORBR|nr:hypothetical protein B0T20DRAFT_394017 [Sordaria brevicollis]
MVKARPLQHPRPLLASLLLLLPKQKLKSSTTRIQNNRRTHSPQNSHNPLTRPPQSHPRQPLRRSSRPLVAAQCGAAAPPCRWLRARFPPPAFRPTKTGSTRSPSIPRPATTPSHRPRTEDGDHMEAHDEAEGRLRPLPVDQPMALRLLAIVGTHLSGVAVHRRDDGSPEGQLVILPQLTEELKGGVGPVGGRRKKVEWWSGGSVGRRGRRKRSCHGKKVSWEEKDDELKHTGTTTTQSSQTCLPKSIGSLPSKSTYAFSTGWAGAGKSTDAREPTIILLAMWTSVVLLERMGTSPYGENNGTGVGKKSPKTPKDTLGAHPDHVQFLDLDLDAEPEPDRNRRPQRVRQDHPDQNAARKVERGGVVQYPPKDLRLRTQVGPSIRKYTQSTNAIPKAKHQMLGQTEAHISHHHRIANSPASPNKVVRATIAQGKFWNQKAFQKNRNRRFMVAGGEEEGKRRERREVGWREQKSRGEVETKGQLRTSSKAEEKKKNIR